ncbi:hypothetical protein LZ017_16960 [Pelomonas sp. CA6]|uniref:hypothetical protein n=1 Tax=Pelomonas sp. CA6 TaxID=2907999 RepID=UPI001F4BF4DB|nr:hypothetical protein [Pelomonas sp. CA6]MCH7345075.1 hypothetical protein [Pelomonas sp. CA6]
MSAPTPGSVGASHGVATSGVDPQLLDELGRRLLPAAGRQLLQLRSLQRRRAQAEAAAAAAAVDRARQALERRREKLAGLRAARQRLMAGLVGALSAQLPRWSACVGAHRAWLEEQLEREEYALINDEQVLEQAQDHLAECQRACVRGEMREALALDLGRAHARQRDHDAERRQDGEREDASAGGRR